MTSLPKKTARNKTPGTVVGMRWQRVPLVFTWFVDAAGFWQGKRDWHCKHVSAWAHLEKKRWYEIIASVREWLRQRDGEGSGCSVLAKLQRMPILGTGQLPTGLGSIHPPPLHHLHFISCLLQETPPYCSATEARDGWKEQIPRFLSLSLCSGFTTERCAPRASLYSWKRGAGWEAERLADRCTGQLTPCTQEGKGRGCPTGHGQGEQSPGALRSPLSAMGSPQGPRDPPFPGR